jgi:hypothetical protein
MSIGGSGSSGASQTQIDPQLKGAWMDGVYQLAQNTNQGGVPQQQVAGFTPAQAAGQTLALQNAGAGETAVNNAVSNATRLAGSTWAPTINGSRTVAIGGNGNPLQDVTAPSQGSLSQYENPYTSDVYNTTLNQLDLARQRAINQNSSNATEQGGEGAWDGSRAGVSDALTNQEFGQQAAETAASLNQGNFNQAQQAAQTYGQMGLQSQIQNQNTTYGVLAGNQDRQQAADIAEAGFLNDTANRQLSAASLLGQIAPTQQGVYGQAAQTEMGVGGQQQQQAQSVLNTAYNNAMNKRDLPLQTMESTFGIIPTTSNGSVTHSSSKSGGIGNN